MIFYTFQTGAPGEESMLLMLDTSAFIFSEKSKSPIDFPQWEKYGITQL